MDELQRLKRRRRRRQEAFTALDEVDDCIKALSQTFQKVEDLALELKTRRLLIFTSPAPERAALLALADSASPILEDITARVEALRAEFSSLKHSDERELKEIEAILPKPTR